jgi:pyruvate formate lyase activating enzyme
MRVPIFIFNRKPLPLKEKGKMQEALFYTKEAESKVRCLLCPHHCLITDGYTGICDVRKNISGKLVTLVYGNLAAIHTDPIEKKPLYHFHPGSRILSVGTAGCNLRCSFCQNWHLSQGDPEYYEEKSALSPENLVENAAGIPGNIGIAYTYNEPVVFYEYMAHVSRLAKKKGLKNVVVSNGFIDPEPLQMILPDLDAFNIDLKSFNNTFYRRITGGKLEPVLQTLKAIAHAGKHLEITFLLIPGLNDSQDEFRGMVDWIYTNLGEHIPLHISRYFPAWKMTTPPTSVSMMEMFTAIAREKLTWVYPGNLSGSRDSSSWCPGCGALLIKREYYITEIVGLNREGQCTRCSKTIAVVLT